MEPLEEQWKTSASKRRYAPEASATSDAKDADTEDAAPKAVPHVKRATGKRGRRESRTASRAAKAASGREVSDVQDARKDTGSGAKGNTPTWVRSTPDDAKGRADRQCWPCCPPCH